MAKQRSKRGRRILLALGIAGILALALGITLAFLPRNSAVPGGSPGTGGKTADKAVDGAAGVPSGGAEGALEGTDGAEGDAAAGGKLPGGKTGTEKGARSEKRGSLYIIVDDVGNNLHQLETFLDFPGNITFAVLPGLSYTDKAVDLIRKSGKGLMLHQPMEALGGEDPGPEALYADMSPDEVSRVLEKNLRQVKGAKALNNHMGSKVTSQESTVRSILETLAVKGVTFVDSYTTSESAVERIAAEMDITTYRRDIFLDNQQNIEYYTKAVEEAKSTAEKKGHAVLIGHVWAADLAQTLMDLYPELVEEGFELEDISRLTGLED